jgi:putative SOS response-associated peptidase YedK
MCGRFALEADEQALKDALDCHVGMSNGSAPRYNIAPSQHVSLVRTFNGVREWASLQWGLVPHWASDLSIGARLINARAETAAIKPSFRDALASRRCVIPATGFYEWESRRDGKQPYVIRPRDGSLMAFAGLWERWLGPGGESHETVVILTTVACEQMKWLHDRMPVILPRQGMGAWLDFGSGPESIGDLLAGESVIDLNTHPVSRKVNSPTHEGPDLMDEVPDSLFPR